MGCVGGIPAAAVVTAAAAGGDNGAGGRSQDEEYPHHLQAIADNVLAVMIN